MYGKLDAFELWPQFYTKKSTNNTVIVNRHRRLRTVSLLLENLRASAICEYASGEATRSELWSSKHTKNYNRIYVFTVQCAV